MHDAIRHVPDLGLLQFDDAARRLGSVDEQVPMIRGLRRRRCARPRGFDVESCAVAADDDHAGMGGEPTRTGSEERPSSSSMTRRRSRSQTTVP